MATEFINRIASPMELCVETLDQPTDKVEELKRSLEAKQGVRSPFLIGSIEEVNQRISRLDRKLQGYTELICESRASESQDDIDPVLWNDFDRDTFHTREKETKEVNQFAGIYTLKSTFVPGRSTRVRNISKISMKPCRISPAKKDPGKPKFVELHQYPGYDPTELTPLPDDIAAVDILQKAADASMNLDKKPQFRPAFEKLFYSDLSQAILLDIFWYYFLEKFQSSRNSQMKLFNRVAHNYVQLMIYAKDPLYRDTFFKKYPMLMTQAVYAATCHSFPDSYRQFGESFKDDLVSMVMEWMTGLHPPPRYWLTWDFEKLEPPNMKTREEMANNSKKVNMRLNFDYLDSLVSTKQNSLSISEISLNQSSKSSISSSQNRTARGHRNKWLTSHKGMKVSSLTSSQDNSIIDMVESAQDSPRRVSQKGQEMRRITEALPAIREMTREDDSGSERKKQTPRSKILFTGEKELQKVESHPACKGPDFVKSVFNMHARSPLVAHYVRMNNLKPLAGTNVLLERTEMENLPPLGFPTYRDVIKTSNKAITDIARKFQKMYARNTRQSNIFMKKQQAERRAHLQKESVLLSNTKLVKRLSDLLILEQRKDPDSLSVNVDAAIEAALMGIDVTNQ
ncbi:protein FAM227B-like [Gigantopelta aegis]|uniref:protein FAM227B-like n=1 Tax=Gigantopelta aegis TaxID=1735272 RepID=UPI001B88D5A4|nr:protein FAM227B-like [Gigantopelta aegis]